HLPIGYAHGKKAVPEHSKHHRARTDRDRRARPFGNKSGLHAAELAQTSACQTVKTRNATAKRLFHSQLNRGIEQSLEKCTQGAARHQKTERQPGIASDSKREQANGEADQDGHHASRFCFYSTKAR